MKVFRNRKEESVRLGRVTVMMTNRVIEIVWVYSALKEKEFMLYIILTPAYREYKLRLSPKIGDKQHIRPR